MKNKITIYIHAPQDGESENELEQNIRKTLEGREYELKEKGFNTQTNILDLVFKKKPEEP